MELTYEEKLKLADSKEHLQVVLGNIRTANNQLMGILNVIEQANAKVAELEKQREELSKQIIKDTVDQERIKKNLFDREKSILLREAQLEINEKESKSRIDKSNIEHETIKGNIRSLNQQHSMRTEVYGDKIYELTNAVSTLKEQIKEHEETIKKQHSDKKKLEGEINSLTATKERAEKELADFLHKSTVEMGEITKSIEIEKEKIKIPLKVIEFETEKLKVFRTDLAVIQARLTDQYKLQNPDKQLPFELQIK